MDKGKTWHITATRQGGETDEYFIPAPTLYEAFMNFCQSSFYWNLAGIQISEVKRNE